MQYQHFTSFNLTDPKTGITKNLTDDFGGIIINTNDEVYERECMPQINFITAKNDMLDGEMFISSTYGNRLIELEIFFSHEKGGGDLFELKKWLGKKYQQLFTWEDDFEDKGIYAIEQGNWKSQVYYNKKFYGKIGLKFVCHDPYYFKIKDRNTNFDNMVIGQEYIVRNKGNCNSYPFIKITPISPIVVFQWNNLIITLKNLNGNTIYLDCKACDCYEVIGDVKKLATLKYSSTDFLEYPEIDCENGNIVKLLSGGISKMIVEPNTIFI